MIDARMFSKVFTNYRDRLTSFRSLPLTLVTAARRGKNHERPFTKNMSTAYEVVQVARELHTIRSSCIRRSSLGHHGFFRPRRANGRIHSHRTGRCRRECVVQAVQLL